MRSTVSSQRVLLATPHLLWKKQALLTHNVMWICHNFESICRKHCIGRASVASILPTKCIRYRYERNSWKPHLVPPHYISAGITGCQSFESLLPRIATACLSRKGESSMMQGISNWTINSPVAVAVALPQNVLYILCTDWPRRQSRALRREGVKERQAKLFCILWSIGGRSHYD